MRLIKYKDSFIMDLEKGEENILKFLNIIGDAIKDFGLHGAVKFLSRFTTNTDILGELWLGVESGYIVDKWDFGFCVFLVQGKKVESEQCYIFKDLEIENGIKLYETFLAQQNRKHQNQSNKKGTQVC